MLVGAFIQTCFIDVRIEELYPSFPTLITRCGTLCAQDEEREAGDLGNLLTHPGHPLTLVSWAAADLTLGDGGPRDIAGRSIVVHAEEDKGARVACGVINLLK